MKTPTELDRERNRAIIAYKREAWAAGITSPYRLGRYAHNRLSGMGHEEAIKANLNKTRNNK